jgi:quercetin dioxygenase-like cupin family protein
MCGVLKLKESTMKATLIAVLILLAMVSGAVLFAQAPVVRITPDKLKWQSNPEDLGFSQAIVEGDPAKPGIYIIQVKFPPGVMSKPHFHGETRYATVIKGTWYTGEGDVFDPSKTVPLKPGSFMKHPAGTHHYDGSKDEEVIVQLMGMGPSTTTRMKPNEGLFGHSVPAPANKK